MKNVNYKYLNILLLLGIIYLLFLLKGIWLGAFKRIFSILLPFLISFCLAYVLYPFLKFLVSKKIPKFLSIFIIIAVIILIVGLTIYFVVPVFVTQAINLLSNLAKVSSDLAIKYNLNMTSFNKIIETLSTKIFQIIEESISTGSIFVILNSSIGYLSNMVIIFIVTIYFLSDMEKIRSWLKKYLIRTNNKRYLLLDNIDREIYSYLKGLGIFMVIQFFEYTFLFAIIGHPNFLLIGVLACITTVIPYFGGIITNIIALIIASVVSIKVFILTLIITLVFPNIDGYVISPKIYGKTNQLPPLLTIFVVSAGGALMGLTGIIIAVPLTIILMAIYKSYKNDINSKLSFKKKV